MNIKNVKRIRTLDLGTSIFLVLLACTNLVAQVKIYKGTEIIPTYKLGDNETSPIFYTGRGVQGAQGKIYPYPSQTSLSAELTDTKYEMVYLENEYIKVKILPAFGGRLFSAIDKTNGHEIFHTNSVIKPDLIGTLGAWISGGIEWCFPNHHRTTTMLPSDYRMIENDDGSATVWIGETEKTMDLRGVIGMTLRPGRSFIEVDYRIANTNTSTQSFLFWANVAVTSNDNFRTFWPPSQEIGVFHNNADFTEWPISHQKYSGADYTKGVDLTWWKNHPQPVSFFMWDGKEGFIGGYDYGQNAGTVHVGNPIENSTSKLWQFGPGLQGQNARRKLTDDGKAYVELMTGTFSNNQPDYSWILPHSVKKAKNYWYPLRDIEIVKNATKDASVTLQMRDKKTIFYGFNTTKAFKDAQLFLRYGDDLLAKKKLDIDPANPFTATYKAKKIISEYDLKVELRDSSGHELVSYLPYKSQHPELPEDQERVKRADELETVEDLYLTGRFIEQYHRAGIEPDDYYLAALKKSPDDYRVNMALGIRRFNQTKYEEALSYLQTAGNKLQIKYKQPKEGELYYYMGLAQKELGLLDDAYNNFGRSTWYYEWYASANYELSQLESKMGNFDKALEFIEEAYSTNARDGRINVLYSALLRKSGKKDKAKILILDLLAYDPLDFTALYEKNLLEGNQSLSEWQENMQDLDNNYIEVATQYMNAGFLDDGIALLSSLENPSNPLIYYYLSWFYKNSGDAYKAAESQKMAKTKSLDYVFPYRKETEKILENALEINPRDATAYYLLGNLLYDKRPSDAISAWEEAAKLDTGNPMVIRNLAFGSFYQKNDASAAIAYMKHAIILDKSHPLWYAELSKYYENSDLDSQENLNILRENMNIVEKDVTAPKNYVELLNLNGDYDEAINFLDKHHFRTWEGGRETYWMYVDAHVLKALELMSNTKYKLAVEELEKALLYPENLEVGKPLNDEKNAMIYYYMGNAFDEMGEHKKAKWNYERSAAADNGYGMDELLYFQGKSLEELGKNKDAQHLFEKLIAEGKSMRENGSKNSLIAVEESTLNNKKMISTAYFLEGLGNEGIKNTHKAKNLFKNAIEANRNNLWAKLFL